MIFRRFIILLSARFVLVGLAMAVVVWLILRPGYHSATLLASLVLVSMVAEPLTALVDTGFVAQLGIAPLAAMGAAATFLSTLFWVFNFLAVGTQTEVAQSIGVPLTTVTIDPLGNVIHRREVLKRPGEQQGGQLTIPLPEEPIAVGGVWSFPHEIVLPLLHQALICTAAARGCLSEPR